MIRRTALTSVVALALLLSACSPASLQKELTIAYNVLNTSLPVAANFVSIEHSAGNISDSAYLNFTTLLTQVQTKDLPLFQSGIAAVTNSAGAVALFNNLVPVVNQLIASGVAFKNPKTQQQALGYVAGAALVFNGISAALGARTLVVPSIPAATAELQQVHDGAQRASVLYYQSELKGAF